MSRKSASRERGKSTPSSGRQTKRTQRAPGPGDKPIPGPALLQKLFERSGLRLSKPELQSFWTFHELLRRRNAELDLTRLHGFESIVIKHYVDCALVPTLVDLPSPLLDLGTGAGFPGIPLAILRPDLRILLAEGRKRRVAFLEEAIRVLGLTGLEVVPGRVGAGFDHRVRGVITRAVGSISSTFEILAPWVETGTQVFFMKGPGFKNEVDGARQDFAGRFRIQRVVPYSITATPYKRCLVVGERVEERVVIQGQKETQDATEATANVREIRSEANPTFKLLQTLSKSRGIRKQGRALLAGMRPILEVLRDFPERCEAWLTPGTAPRPPAEAPEQLTWYRLAAPLFRALDTFGTGPPLLLVRVPALQAWDDSDWPSGCTLFVPFQDPENLGAVIRSAAAFGVPRIVLMREAAHPFHPRSARAAGSTLLRVPLLLGPSIHEFEPQGAPVRPLSTTGQDVGTTPFPERFGLLPGLEGPGIPEKWRTRQALCIPMQPGVESLNATTATAIALYLWRRQVVPAPEVRATRPRGPRMEKNSPPP